MMRQLGASSYLQPSRRLTTCAVASTSLERWGIDGKAPEKQRDTKWFDSDFHHSEEVAWKSKVDWERATSERPSPDLVRPNLLKLHHVLQRNAPRIVCFLSQVDNIILRERLFQTRVLHISFCCATASEVAHISASHGHAIVEFYDIRSAQVDGTGWWIGTGRTLQLGEMQRITFCGILPVAIRDWWKQQFISFLLSVRSDVPTCSLIHLRSDAVGSCVWKRDAMVSCRGHGRFWCVVVNLEDVWWFWWSSELQWTCNCSNKKTNKKKKNKKKKKNNKKNKMKKKKKKKKKKKQ